MSVETLSSPRFDFQILTYLPVHLPYLVVDQIRQHSKKHLHGLLDSLRNFPLPSLLSMLRPYVQKNLRVIPDLFEVESNKFAVFDSEPEEESAAREKLTISP